MLKEILGGHEALSLMTIKQHTTNQKKKTTITMLVSSITIEGLQ